MHGAPSVNYPVGRSRFSAVLLLLAWLLGAVALAAWALQSKGLGWRLWLASGVLASSGAFAAWRWRRCAVGVLAWDGDSWSWSGREHTGAGVPQVCLDLQHWLLLRWDCGAATHWLWVERTRLPERWDDLRRAVYSRARPQALRQAREPAAKP